MRKRQPLDVEELHARLLAYQHHQRSVNAFGQETISPASDTALSTTPIQEDQLERRAINTLGQILFLILVFHLTTNRSRLFQ